MQMDQAKAPELGEGPFTVVHLTSGLWRVEDTRDGSHASGQIMHAKSAARKCRELNEATPAPAVPFTPAEVAEIIEVLTPGKGRKRAAPKAPAAPVAEPTAEGLGDLLTGPDGETPELEPIAPDLEPSVEELDASDTVERFPSAARHEWLEDAATFGAKLLRERTELTVNVKVRVSVGWPTGRKSIGECWHMEASGDGHREIFVSPALEDGTKIVDVLVHELIHACLPKDAKHGPMFGKPARAVGLEGKLTATHAGPELEELIRAWVAERGPYPAKALDRYEQQKKQTTRLLKCVCPACGYTVRVTKVWAEKALPVCGIDGEDMELA